LIGLLGFGFSLAALIFCIVLLVLIFGLKRQMRFQSAYSAALSAYHADDKERFVTSAHLAKRLGHREKKVYLLLADFYLKQKDYAKAISALKDCPTFNKEVKAYFEKIRMQQGLSGN